MADKAATAAATASEGKAESGEAAPAAKPQSVKIADAQRQFLVIETVGAPQATDSLALPGRVTFRPQAQAAVGATTAGRVVAVLVQGGQVVKAGTPMVTIESADASAARATLDQATTRLGVAESYFKRQVEMVEKGVGLEFERHEAEARLKEARAELGRARGAVDLIGAGQGIQVTVRAPVNGVVMAIRTSVGAGVAPGGDPLVELGDPGQLQLVAQVAESDLSRIGVGQEADVEIPALSLRVAARVESFSPRVDPESRRMQVYLAMGSRPAALRSGMLAQISLRVKSEEGVSVPASAVLIKEGKRRVVYLAREDGGFESREVKTGRNQDGKVVILQGLVAGEKVVVRGAVLLDTQAELLL